MSPESPTCAHFSEVSAVAHRSDLRRPTHPPHPHSLLYSALYSAHTSQCVSSPPPRDIRVGPTLTAPCISA